MGRVNPIGWDLVALFSSLGLLTLDISIDPLYFLRNEFSVHFLQ